MVLLLSNSSISLGHDSPSSLSILTPILVNEKCQNYRLTGKNTGVEPLKTMIQ